MNTGNFEGAISRGLSTAFHIMLIFGPVLLSTDIPPEFYIVHIAKELMAIETLELKTS